MISLPAVDKARFFMNPSVAPAGPYPEAAAKILNRAGLAAARAAITGWEGYAPTPLAPLDGLAGQAGLARIWIKDESRRFGLGSFKPLGGAYAVARLVAREGSDITVCCATDGNHGRSVAWGAGRFGCRCVIYIHEHVSRGRQAAIEAYGAEVRRVAGNYDDSVHKAAADAAANGWFVVSDTSYPGYMEIPRDVMHGYMLLAEEAIAQLPAGESPSHVFVQGGVGGLAAAVAAQFWLHYGADAPRVVVVEPDKAACLFESARSGRPVRVTGALDTLMAGLAAGEVSLLAWRVLEPATAAFMTVPDAAAVAAMRLLAEGVGGDVPLVAGESAVAGLVGALAAKADPAWAADLKLDADSRVMLISSEGATDPELYREIVGPAAEALLAQEELKSPE
jgi:diaminopropionate ammonia-lyase